MATQKQVDDAFHEGVRCVLANLMHTGDVHRAIDGLDAEAIARYLDEQGEQEMAATVRSAAPAATRKPGRIKMVRAGGA